MNSHPSNALSHDHTPTLQERLHAYQQALAQQGGRVSMAQFVGPNAQRIPTPSPTPIQPPTQQLPQPPTRPTPILKSQPTTNTHLHQRLSTGGMTTLSLDQTNTNSTPTTQVKLTPPPLPTTVKRGSFISPSNIPLDRTTAVPTPTLPPKLKSRNSLIQMDHFSTPPPPPPPLIETTVVVNNSNTLGGGLMGFELIHEYIPTSLKVQPSSPTSSTSSSYISRSPDTSTTKSPLELDGDDGDGISFLDALRESAPSVALSRGERLTIAQGRSARVRDLLAVDDLATSSKQPDYAMNLLGDDHASDDDSPSTLTRDSWYSAYSLFQERHAEQWKKHIGWIQSNDPTGQVFLQEKLKSKRAKNLVRIGGIPPAVRGRVWEILAGSRQLRLAQENRDYYSKLLIQLENHPTKSTRDIEKDVSRTMHGHLHFKDPSGLGQSQLKRGLCAFSFRHPSIGYAQSMSSVLATILLHFNEEEHAFWLFDALLSNILPQDYYTPSMLGTKTDCAILKKLVKKRLTKLHTHFHKKGIDLDMISLPWFMCLYVHILPLQTAMRVWDAIFYKGSHVLLSVAITLLAKHEEELCTINNVGEIFQRLQVLGKDEYDCELLMTLALGKHHVRAVDAGRMREEVRAELEKVYLAQLRFK